MMGFFFAVSCIIGIVLCCFGGSGSTALDCLLAGADSAVELSISLAGAYLLWMGLINVASEACGANAQAAPPFNARCR